MKAGEGNPSKLNAILKRESPRKQTRFEKWDCRKVKAKWREQKWWDLTSLVSVTERNRCKSIQKKINMQVQREIVRLPATEPWRRRK